MAAFFGGLYGADAKAESGREDSWNAVKTGAKSSFYDTTDSDALKAEQQKQMAALAARTGPTMAKTAFGPGAYAGAAKVGPVSTVAAPTLARGDELAARGIQQSALGHLATGMAGGGPSVAGLQMKSSVDGSLAAANAAQGGAPRGMSALVAHQAANANVGGLNAANMASAQTKIGEVNAAGQNFGSLASGMRAADIAMAGSQAKYNQDAGLFNAKALNDASFADASFAQQTNAFNAVANQKNAEMAQAAELANVEATLRSRGMTDAAIANVLSQYQAQFNADNAAKRMYHEFAISGDQNYEAGKYARTRAIEADRDARASAVLSVATGGVGGAYGGGGAAGKKA